MANIARNILMTGLVFTVTAFIGGPAFAAEDGQMRIVIHVDNYALIRDADRSEAEDAVTRIYAKAGVRIAWVTGHDHADAPGLHVRVQLLPADMAMKKIRTERLDNSVLGRAARGAGRAFIFTHRIASMALRHRDNFRRLLGLVMAHEVGHLVLPFYGHSERGIMRATFGVRSTSFHEFTGEEADAIRATLMAASRPQAADFAYAAVGR
jgi:hypothetical protein